MSSSCKDTNRLLIDKSIECPPEFSNNRNKVYSEAFQNVSTSPRKVSVKLRRRKPQNPVYGKDRSGLLDLIKSCGREKNIIKARRIHADIVWEDWIKNDIYVATTLLRTYAKCGALREAQSVFDEIQHKDVVSWTALIAGYVDNGFGDEALKRFRQMEDEGVSPNAVTYICTLRACSIVRSLTIGEELHARVREQALLCKDVVLGNTLICMYAKCGALDKARNVFEQLLQRDVVSWNALISGYVENGISNKALKCLEQMQDEGVFPNAVTYICCLKACAIEGSLEIGEEIYARASAQADMCKDVILSTTAINMYAKCGALKEAEKVFDQLKRHDVVSWTALIAGYIENGLADEALKCYRQMEEEGVSPNAVTYVFILKACAIIGCLGMGEKIYERVIDEGLLSKDIVLGNALIDMYAKCGVLVKACEVFNLLPIRDVVSWNALLAGYIETGLGCQALKCFVRMEDEGFSPDAVTYIWILKACATLGFLEIGEEIHVRLKEQGLLNNNVILSNSLIHMYAKCGAIERAHQEFDHLLQRNVVSWNVLIAGYADCGFGDKALECYAQMGNEEVCADAVTYICVLKACAIIGSLEIGEQIHTKMREQGLMNKDVMLNNTLIDMYAKCGALVQAHALFDQLPQHDVVSWNVLIAGYARVGQVKKTLECFTRMRIEGILPNLVTFLIVLNACSHAAWLEEGEKLFYNMIIEYRLTPTIEHYSCMVDLLGRAGQLDKAKLFLFDYVPLFLAFLSACRKWVNINLGRWAFEKLVHLDEKCVSAYVIMANIYAAAGMQSEAAAIEAIRVKNRAWKVPGQY